MILRATRLSALVVIGVASLIGLGCRTWLVLCDDGVYIPDEIYQSLEPAHRLVFGYGLQAWEFVYGARNFTFPALLAVPMKLGALLGGATSGAYLFAARLGLMLWSMCAIAGTYALARAYQADRLCAAVSGALCALLAPMIYFSHRALSETASTPAVVLGLALGLSAASGRWRLGMGASLLGLAVLLRLQNGLFCAGLLAVLLGRGQRRRAAEAAGWLFLWALLYGLIDRLTWGGWFRSVPVYLGFNVFSGIDPSSIVGRQQEPAWYYGRVFFSSLFPAAPLVAGLALLGAGRARGLALIVFVYLLILSSLAHNKQYRFLLIALPLIFALCGVGLGALRRPLLRQGLLLLVLLAAGFSALHFWQLRFADLGQSLAAPGRSAYGFLAPRNQMLAAARDLPDLCGLKVENAPDQGYPLTMTGGYTYLHRDVPLYGDDSPPRASGSFNYIITSAAPADGEREVAIATTPGGGRVALRRLPIAGCRKDPAFEDRLPVPDPVREFLLLRRRRDGVY